MLTVLKTGQIEVATEEVEGVGATGGWCWGGAI